MSTSHLVNTVKNKNYILLIAHLHLFTEKALARHSFHFETKHFQKLSQDIVVPTSSRSYCTI